MASQISKLTNFWASQWRHGVLSGGGPVAAAAWDAMKDARPDATQWRAVVAPVNSVAAPVSGMHAGVADSDKIAKFGAAAAKIHVQLRPSSRSVPKFRTSRTEATFAATSAAAMLLRWLHCHPASACFHTSKCDRFGQAQPRSVGELFK